ncbi:repair protein Rad1/Rec1/Rad17-domain-containing protein [Podospora conica]|nr:repair protein Rad1/Rec1/Rad17-domain-containing protein [Schizothecium conicum]
MDSSLHEVWQAASSQPFLPTVGKNSQFLVGFTLLVGGLLLSAIFAIQRSFSNLAVIGVPAALALGFAIGFANKVHVEITEDGLRFSVDHARVMQGVVHWNKSLFTTYKTNLPAAEDGEEDPLPPLFQISVPALLETLQIFGAVDAVARQADAQLDPYRSRLKDYKPDAFSNQILGMTGSCSLSYTEEGEPLSIVMDETGVKTTCNLTTYVAELPDDIPFDLDELSFKIIMPARVLLDALGEIASSQPEKLTIAAVRKKPYLRLSSTGALGSSAVDFGRGRDLLETLSVSDPRWRQSFKFEIIKSATDAMKIATKVSLRGDRQGVLSMQFMVEVEGAGHSFLDFRFVPYAEEEYEEDVDEEDEEGQGEEL